MSRFGTGVVANVPLLPARPASQLGLSSKKPSKPRWREIVSTAGPALLIAAILFGSTLFIFKKIEDRRDSVRSWEEGEEASKRKEARHSTKEFQSRRNEELQRRLDSLIDEATKVAEEQGILTEVEMADRMSHSDTEGEDWSWVLDNKDRNVELPEVALICNAKEGGEECGPHGTCVKGQCKCAAAFTGKYCGHSVLLTQPFIPPDILTYSIGYEQQYMLLKDSKLGDWYVGDDVVHAEEIAPLQQYLDATDDILQGKVYESCAVVGPSSSLLLAALGDEIDSREMIFRIELEAPIKGYEKHVGSKQGIRVAGTLPKRWRALVEGKATVLASPTIDNLRMLHAKAPFQPRILHPVFEDHVGGVFDVEFPSPGLKAVLLAINVCQKVDIYGLAPLLLLPHTYYDACAEEEDTTMQEEWHDLYGLVEAGLLQIGEKCVQECVIGHVNSSGGEEVACTLCRKEHKIDIKAIHIPDCKADDDDPVFD